MSRIVSAKEAALTEACDLHGCEISLRRVDGPQATEIFLLCEPPRSAREDVDQQTESIYRAVLEVLHAQGAGFAAVICETIFVRDAAAGVELIRTARARVLSAGDGVGNEIPNATTEIEQPPLDADHQLLVSIQALIPRSGEFSAERIESKPACECAECARGSGLLLKVGAEHRLHAGGLYGRGENAYEQTLGMFRAAEALLQQVGMDFHDVVRTWIHLEYMDRDYDDLNRARREFFRERGIEPVPASTGIGGRSVPAEHDLSLGIYALKAEGRIPRTVMSAPTLNEAMTYGADFVRGMRIEDANKIALQVSGTASVDEAGNTAFVGDFDAQADRMLVNVAALLERQGASFADIVSGITYLKDLENADRLRAKFRAAGFEGFPNALVEARVCRPDFLCETEVLGVLPRSGA